MFLLERYAVNSAMLFLTSFKESSVEELKYQWN